MLRRMTNVHGVKSAAISLECGLTGFSFFFDAGDACSRVLSREVERLPT